MCIENGVNVPPLACCNVHQRLVARLSPRPDIFSSFLECSSQCIRCLLVHAVQRIAMHVVSHFRLVNVARSSLLRIPKHLICHLHVIHIRRVYIYTHTHMTDQSSCLEIITNLTYMMYIYIYACIGLSHRSFLTENEETWGLEMPNY
jgi:hypothetical protein